MHGAGLGMRYGIARGIYSNEAGLGILQSKGKERNAGNRDEIVPSGKNDSRIRGLRERPQKAGNFWRELSVPSISSDWRVLKKI